MSYEYRIYVSDELLTDKFLQNEYGVDNWELIGIIRDDNGRYHYHFKRG